MPASKNLYVAVADKFAARMGNLAECSDDWTPKREMQFLLTTLAWSLADVFEQDNPRFDRSRFLQACAVDIEE